MIDFFILGILVALIIFVSGMMVGANGCRKELARDHEIITNMYIKAADERDLLKTKLMVTSALNNLENNA